MDACRPPVSLVPHQLMSQARASVLVGRVAAPQSPGSRMSAGVATQRCQAAMMGVAMTQVRAHVGSTVRRRHHVAAELQEWLATLPEEWGVTLETAGPEHVLWYAQEHWLTSHTGE